VRAVDLPGVAAADPTELLQLTVHAAKLFAGIEGKTLLAASESAATASSAMHIGDADRRLH